MKKYFYIFLASIAALFVSCAEELDTPENPDSPTQEQPVPTDETITFSASIQLSDETKAAIAAGESGMDIHWVSLGRQGMALIFIIFYLTKAHFTHAKRRFPRRTGAP